MASRETFKPGLFDIGLNIEMVMNNQFLLAKSKQVTHYLEIEPSYTKPAIRNMQLVLLFQLDTGRMRTRSMFEELITEYPNDLNVLADLIYVYKKMGCERDSDWYKEQLELHKDDPLLQARSILGQANALTYDLTNEQNITPDVLLKDTWRLLNMKDKRLQRVSKAIELVVDAYNAVKTIPVMPFQQIIDSKEIAVEKFEKGIKMLEDLKCSQEEILVWKHNFAIALGRLDMWKFHGYNYTDNRVDNRIKSLEAHLDVIENLSPIEEPLKRYVAKSCIFFAQLYMSRKMNQVRLPARIGSQDLNLLSRKAISLCPNDPTVLKRCARYQYNQRKCLKAIKLYDESISLIPDVYINWFAYVGRSETYYHYSQQQSNIDQCNKFLELAYSDTKMSLQVKCSLFDRKRMADICFARAMPDHESGVGFRCQDIDFIYEALETLNEGLKNTNATKDSKIYSDLGRYYPYIGEYRKSIESLKTALELNKWSTKCSWVFSDLCKCFVAFYKREKDQNLLTEFRFMLKEAKKKNCNDWVKNARDMMFLDDAEMLTDLIQNMIEWDVRRCEWFIKQTLNGYVRPNLKREFERKLQERKDQESDINGPTEIQKSQSTNKCRYDFFVSHSEKDRDWVNSMLRPQLEDYDKEIQFKGFIPSRDFVPGEKVTDSVLKGVRQSRKLLIILTPNYLENNWQKFVGDAMIFSVSERRLLQEKTIIPIILERCRIPDQLEVFNPIFFTEISDWETLRMNLTVNMDSETGFEQTGLSD